MADEPKADFGLWGCILPPVVVPLSPRARAFLEIPTEVEAVVVYGDLDDTLEMLRGLDDANVVLYTPPDEQLPLNVGFMVAQATLQETNDDDTMAVH